MGMCNSKVESVPTSVTAPKLHFSIKQNASELVNIATNNTITILLLGASESGKTTTCKQLRLFLGDKFDDIELSNYRVFICSNIVHPLQDILSAMPKLNIHLHDEHAQQCAKLISADIDIDTDSFAPDYLQALKTLWNDADVQMAVERRSEYQLYDSAKYFLDSLDRFNQPSSYELKTDDILMTYSPTTGILEREIISGKHRFKLIDVGGHKGERRKWIHCCNDGSLNAIVFVVPVSEYDLTLRDDELTNRLADAIELFAHVCSESLFAGKPLFLLLNKIDLFVDKIKRRPFNHTYTFPDYNIDNNTGSIEQLTLDYIEKQLHIGAGDNASHVHIYRVSAIDTNSIRSALENMIDLLISHHSLHS